MRELPAPPPFEGRPVDMKECTVCGELMPETEQFFHKDASKHGGLNSQCKICRSRKDKVFRDKAIADRVSSLDAATLEIIVQMGRGGVDQASVPHMASLLESLVFAFGGLQAFSQQYVAQYLMAKPGGAMRSKMLDSIRHLIIKVSESGAAQMPLDQMSQEELEKQQESIEKRLVKRLTVMMEEETGDDISIPTSVPQTDGDRRDTA